MVSNSGERRFVTRETQWHGLNLTTKPGQSVPKKASERSGWFEAHVRARSELAPESTRCDEPVKWGSREAGDVEEESVSKGRASHPHPFVSSGAGEGQAVVEFQQLIP